MSASDDLLDNIIAAALRGGADPARCDELRLAFLELERRNRRAYTIERAKRLARLEETLQHLEPGERALAAQDRMNISRDAYYRLRKVARQLHSSRNSVAR